MTQFLLFFLGVLALVFCSLSIMGILNPLLKSTWLCKTMGWHMEPKARGFDGCSSTGKCPRCGKEVLQDSQRNWF